MEVKEDRERKIRRGDVKGEKTVKGF